MKHPTLIQIVPAGLALFIALASTAAGAESWEYKSYRKGSGGNYSSGNFVSGTLDLEEKDGKAAVRINASVMDVCYRGEMQATVVRTAETTTIEPNITLAGCEKFRFVIRNDGSGGKRETLRGDQWVANKLDHGLTPVK